MNINYLTICTLLTTIYLAYKIKLSQNTNANFYKQIQSLKQMQYAIKTDLYEIKNNGYYDDTEEFWEFELKKRKFQNEIDKLNDLVTTLQSSHYNYEHLSLCQERLQKEFDNMYRDVKDDIVRLNEQIKSIQTASHDDMPS